MSYQIAIDGPAGAGKSTIARKLAKKKGFIYVDTGAMYRAMAYFLLTKKINPTDKYAIEKNCQRANISISYEKGEQIVLLNGKNVNGVIRSEEVGNMASASSSNPKVRERLTLLQKKLAKTNNVVMDGRDIGTCVLPDAELKVFLTAEPNVRAQRRYNELRSKGISCDIRQIEADIVKRDKQDMTRKIAPLKQAEDAILLDTSNMNVDEVVKAILKLCRSKGI